MQPGAKDRLINYAELVLTAFVIVIFGLSACQSGWFALSHIRMGEGQTYAFMFSSIISMAISGLGLIFLLLLKLRKIEESNRERKKIMGLLVPRMAALDASMDGIGLVDQEGRLTYINKALMNLHGLEEEDLPDYVGRTWKDLYTPKGQREIEEKVLPDLEKYGYWKGDAPVIRKNGAVVYAEMSLTVLDDGGLIGTARDITPRIKAQEEKEALQNQFFQAQKMEAMGRLAGGVAHDFNNILASMLGFTEFLLEDLTPDTEDYHFAGQIMSGGQQAQDLVEQILTFSRRDDSLKDVVDLTAVVQKTTDMLRATLPSSILLETDYPSGLAAVRANPTQISQILMNLSVNAIDAMNAQKGRLSIRMDLLDRDDFPYRTMVTTDAPDTECTPPVRIIRIDKENSRLQCGTILESHDYVRLSVSDTGSGIPYDIMEHILDPFFTTKPVDRGTGLGLSSVHGIMAAHRGALVVNSCTQIGTCFELFFPVVEDAVILDTQEEVISDDDIDSGRILVVEDESRVREMLAKLLSRRGYHVDVCTDGDEAVDCLRENPGFYDLVVSDYTMPRMNGTEMAGEIAGDFPSLPIIMLSGFSESRLEKITDDNPNIKTVLRKPVKSNILIRHIRTQLKSR